MSVNTSEEYLDELLQAIEPIIEKAEPKADLEQEPLAEVQETVKVEDNSIPSELANTFTEDGIPMDTEMPMEANASMDEGTSMEENRSMEDDTSMDELLAALSMEKTDAEFEADTVSGADMDVTTMSEEPNTNGIVEEDADVKALLEQFANEDVLGDIQDNADMHIESEVNEPVVSDTEMEKEQQESVSEEPDEDKKSKGLLGFFKKKKNKRDNKEASFSLEQTDLPIEESMENNAGNAGTDSIADTDGNVDTDTISIESEVNITDEETMNLDDLFGQEDGADIDALLMSGAFDEAADTDQNDGQGKNASSKNKKESFFSRVFTMLTEEEDEEEDKKKTKKSTVPEASETGITDENETILEELSKEEKKKRKKEEKERKKKEKDDKKKGKGKESGASDEDAEDKSEKEDAKKKKKKPKKEKPRKVVDIDEKPAKKISKKKIMIVFIFCFSILAMILILQTVVLEVSNARQARWAFDNADYETCYANLYGVERSEEEEEIFQKSYIVLCMQRKWDSYENLKQMDMGVEALNALFEGIRLYRDDMEVKAESYGIVSRISPIYDMMYSELGAYGLSDADIEEILAYESKVSYTKRLEAIVNGTPFVENEWLPEVEEPVAKEPVSEESTGVKSDIVTTPGDINITEPLEDVLPMEEDFLSEEGSVTNQNSRTEETEQDTTKTVQELPEEKVQHTTTVVGSSPVNINDSVQ